MTLCRDILALQRPTESSLGVPLIALKLQSIPWVELISYQFYSQFPGSSNIKETGRSSLKTSLSLQLMRLSACGSIDTED